MASSLSRLVVDMDLRTQEFQKGMRQSIRSMDRLERRSKTLNRSMSRLGNSLKTAGLAFAGLIGIRLGTSLITDFLTLADNIGKTSARIGISTSALQEFRFAAELSGASADAFDNSIQRFSRGLSEARSGTGQLAKVLSAMEISLKESDGTFRSVEDVLDDFSDGLSRTGALCNKPRE